MWLYLCWRRAGVLSLGSLQIAFCFYVYVACLVPLLYLFAEVAFSTNQRSDLLPHTIKKVHFGIYLTTHEIRM